MEFATLSDTPTDHLCNKWVSKSLKVKPYPGYSDIKVLLDSFTKEDIKTVQGHFENDDSDMWEDECDDDRLDNLFFYGFEKCNIQVHRPISQDKKKKEKTG